MVPSKGPPRIIPEDRSANLDINLSITSLGLKNKKQTKITVAFLTKELTLHFKKWFTLTSYIIAAVTQWHHKISCHWVIMKVYSINLELKLVIKNWVTSTKITSLNRHDELLKWKSPLFLQFAIISMQVLFVKDKFKSYQLLTI